MNLLGKPAVFVGMAMVLMVVTSFGSDWLRDYYLGRKATQEQSIHSLFDKPYVTIDGKQPSDSLIAGQPFFVHYRGKRSKTCAFTYTTYAIGSGNAVALKTVSSWLPAGEFTVNELYDLPSALPPGKYRILKRFVHQCGIETYYSNGFDVTVDVVR